MQQIQQDVIQTLKIKARTASKLKLIKERDVIKLRSLERTIYEDLSTTKAEVEMLMEQLQELVNQKAELIHQKTLIDLCATSDQLKLQQLNQNLLAHKNGFDELFERERQASEQRNSELVAKQMEVEEAQKEKFKQISEQNELQAKEAEAIEAECNSLEQECSVLKKRNNAIMLKLRRKLVETEDIRREFIKTIPAPSQRIES